MVIELVKRIWACLICTMIVGLMVLGWEYHHLQMYLQVVTSARTRKREQLHEGGQRECVHVQSQCVQKLTPLNRNPEHLRDAARSYLTQNGLDDCLNRDESDWWVDYTTYVNNGGGVPRKALAKKAKRVTQKRVFTTTPTKVAVVSDQQLARLRGRFAWPIQKNDFWLSSRFGLRKKPNGTWGVHRGIDMAAVRGTAVHAAAAGRVIEARYASGYGNTVVLDHNDGTKTRYAHLDVLRVLHGQRLNQSEIVGDVGDTGFTIKRGKEATHLHFEIYDGDVPVDPLKVLRA